MPLPGSEKYRDAPNHQEAPWEDELVVRANEEVSIVSVLNDYFHADVPENAYGWKTYCVQKWEHRDGGIDRQFRVYSDTNTAHCFAIHGLYTPARLWRIRTASPTLKDAARDLLRVYGIRIKEPTYQERFTAIREASSRTSKVTPDGMLEALQVFLGTIPDYTVRQFDPNVLRVVNSTVEDIQEFCSRDPSLEEARQWLQRAQAQLRVSICR